MIHCFSFIIKREKQSDRERKRKRERERAQVHSQSWWHVVFACSASHPSANWLGFFSFGELLPPPHIPCGSSRAANYSAPWPSSIPQRMGSRTQTRLLSLCHQGSWQRRKWYKVGKSLEVSIPKITLKKKMHVFLLLRSWNSANSYPIPRPSC